MSVFSQWRKHLFGLQADNPQIGKLDHLNRFPKDRGFGGEKDTRWEEFATEIERAVRELDDEFFQNLADASRFLKGSNVTPEAEAIHFATLERLSAGSPSDLTKGSIREEIVEMWAWANCKEDCDPTEKDWKTAREKAERVHWARVWKKSGLRNAKQKGAGRPKGSKNTNW